jgi:hypothetical protein
LVDSIWRLSVQRMQRHPRAGVGRGGVMEIGVFDTAEQRSRHRVYCTSPSLVTIHCKHMYNPPSLLGCGRGAARPHCEAVEGRSSPSDRFNLQPASILKKPGPSILQQIKSTLPSQTEQQQTENRRWHLERRGMRALAANPFHFWPLHFWCLEASSLTRWPRFSKRLFTFGIYRCQPSGGESAQSRD